MMNKIFYNIYYMKKRKLFSKKSLIIIVVVILLLVLLGLFDKKSYKNKKFYKCNNRLGKVTNNIFYILILNIIMIIGIFTCLVITIS